MSKDRKRPLHVWIAGFSLSGGILLVVIILFIVFGCKRWKESKRIKLRRLEEEREAAIQMAKQARLGEPTPGTSGLSHPDGPQAIAKAGSNTETHQDTHTGPETVTNNSSEAAIEQSSVETKRSVSFRIPNM